ncbi:MAG: hypothetical protein Q4F13_15890 [Pseudomonadota bacterium]|nr:hypothetical protein [Pseudomonadota bacterium]
MAMVTGLTTAWAQQPLEAWPCAQNIRKEIRQTDGHETTEAMVVMALLSPRMVYALQEWPRMQKAAEQAGFAVRVWRDPRVPDKEWRAAVQSLGLSEWVHAPVLPQSVAAPCGLLTHAPSALVFLEGRAHPWPIYGVMPDAQWLAVLQSRVQWLRETAAGKPPQRPI